MRLQYANSSAVVKSRQIFSQLDLPLHVNGGFQVSYRPSGLIELVSVTSTVLDNVLFKNTSSTAGRLRFALHFCVLFEINRTNLEV